MTTVLLWTYPAPQPGSMRRPRHWRTSAVITSGPDAAVLACIGWLGSAGRDRPRVFRLRGCGQSAFASSAGLSQKTLFFRHAESVATWRPIVTNVYGRIRSGLRPRLRRSAVGSASALLTSNLERSEPR